ncbi:hypothetical protein AJ80_00787 [Polytolypa hystricis UAMH7299]|uniref:Vacuolar membrane PQ loop repeat protein n=1 Tax=Polytolypa hystricis (strain UAMH7299) TaxID=1447883 RepID=A0A2B7Z0T8_POLH7|nr:hypothetical protein AJ80_00787 [Polytolypa hystricis UAMH7299]
MKSVVNGSAEAISLAFIVVWFVGDVLNLIGSLWAHLVPVVIAIAVYFCIADGVLISQVLYYNIKNAPEEVHERAASTTSEESDVPGPSTPLLNRRGSEKSRRSSYLRARSSIVEDPLVKMLEQTEPQNAWVKNALSVAAMCLIGTAGWAIAWQTGVWKPTPVKGPESAGDIAVGAQIVGYASAVLYLGARIPQIIKNHRDKSCEGLSLLFFILSLMGNATYGAGILFHSTGKDYFLTNLPWLIGSLGTMVEDIMIFVQFRIYATQDIESTSAVI